jgi:hypothetical protein
MVGKEKPLGRFGGAWSGGRGEGSILEAFVLICACLPQSVSLGIVTTPS